MTSGAAGSIPNPIAGKLLVTIIIQRISTGLSGKIESPVVSLKTSPTNNTRAWETFSASKCYSQKVKTSSILQPKHAHQHKSLRIVECTTSR